jgi:hypothetical protein
LFVSPDASQRTVYPPGELAQWDLLFQAVDIPLGFGQIVGVSGYRARRS